MLAYSLCVEPLYTEWPLHQYNKILYLRVHSQHDYGRHYTFGALASHLGPSNRHAQESCAFDSIHFWRIVSYGRPYRSMSPYQRPLTDTP